MDTECSYVKNAVFEWFSRFKSGKMSIDDQPRFGRTSLTQTKENYVKIRKIVLEDWKRLRNSLWRKRSDLCQSRCQSRTVVFSMTTLLLTQHSLCADFWIQLTLFTWPRPMRLIFIPPKWKGAWKESVLRTSLRWRQMRRRPCLIKY